MAMEVRIQVGDKHYAIDAEYVPPIGTTIRAHKHLFDGGTYPLLEITNHEWRLEEAQEEGGNPVLYVTLKTRIVAT